MSGRDQVLVTGGSGFLGAHTVALLLQNGYLVRTTVRQPKREPDVRAMLDVAGVDAGDRLRFVTADLTRDEGWVEATRGCRYVLHVASPFPPQAPNDDDEVIGPARHGTLRVLRAACAGGAERVVLTSSFAAIGYSPKSSGTPYDETDWTDPEQPGLSAYIRSKTIAERAAWDFVTGGVDLQMSVVNPVGIFGPVLGPDYSGSIQLIRRLLDGSMRAIPRLLFGVVDVRDVASLHLAAMTAPQAAGERFLAAAGEQFGLRQTAETLRRSLGHDAAAVPTRVLPDWVAKLGGRVQPQLAAVAREVGVRKAFTSDKARRVLHWRPRTNEETVVATARSLLDHDLIRRQPAPA